jgi:hypothetical protein
VTCCGKGAVNAAKSNPDPAVLSQQNQGKTIKHITTLDGYDEKDLEWVAYRGPKQGSAGRILIRGASHLPSEYPILGNGHVFQIHKLHKSQFEARQKLGFEVNQPDPRKQEKTVSEPILQPQLQPQVIEIAKPELSTLIGIDRIGSETREIEIVSPAEVIVEPNAAENYSAAMVTQDIIMPTDYFKQRPQASSLHVSNLGLSDALTKMLDENNYTVEKLAEITPEQLARIKGIGLKRGQVIIEKAQKLIKQE